MLDILEINNISESPFSSPFNIQIFTFNVCFAIKGGLTSMLIYLQTIGFQQSVTMIK